MILTATRPSANFRSLLSELQTGAGVLAALAAALTARSTGQELPPGVREHVHDILCELGADSLVAALPGAELASLLGEIRTYAATHTRLIADQALLPGWAPTDPTLLKAAGDVSAEFPRALQRFGSELDGLLGRLARPGAAFLDVGVGVGTLSIEMARAWPLLQVVGLEPWRPALELARCNVSEAGLESRVALFETAGQDLEDVAAFDLAWVPSLFISPQALPAVLDRVRVALRPGAWLLLPALQIDAQPLVLSVARLRTGVWGGSALGAEEMKELLLGRGFVEVRAMAAAPGAAIGLFAARS